MPKHLRFRKLKKTDWRDLYEYGKDQETTQYLRWGPYKNEGEAKQSIRLLKAQKGHVFAIEVYGKMIGTATIFSANKETKRIEIGYVLNKNYWGMGIGYATIMQILKFSTAWYKGYTLFGEVDQRNIVSINLLKKSGFKIVKCSDTTIYLLEMKII